MKMRSKGGKGGGGDLQLGPLLAQLGDLVGPVPEDEHVVLPNLLGNLHVGPVHGAHYEGAVHGELHVAGARRLRARRADVLRQLRSCSRGSGGRRLWIGLSVLRFKGLHFESNGGNQYVFGGVSCLGKQRRGPMGNVSPRRSVIRRSL